MSSEFDGRDLAVGAAFGIRRWKVDSLGRLLGNSYTCGIWRPGENQAVCRKDFDDGYLKSFNYVTFNYTTPLSIQSSSPNTWGRALAPNPNHYENVPPPSVTEEIPATETHSAPDINCGCGFWAYFGERAETGEGGVIGVIRASGLVLVGTKGFRAEKAEIVALRLKADTPYRDFIARNYPDVGIYPTRKAMLAEWPVSTNLAPVPSSPETDPEFWTRSAT